jgi:hypothetical protein
MSVRVEQHHRPVQTRSRPKTPLPRWRRRIAPLVAAAWLIGGPKSAAAQIILRDVSPQTGIDFVHNDGSGGRHYIVETVASGIATLGAVAWEQGDYEKAVASLRQAVKLGPDLTNAFMFLGSSLLNSQWERGPFQGSFRIAS